MTERTRLDLNRLFGKPTDEVLDRLAEAGLTASTTSEQLSGPMAMLFGLGPAPKAFAGEHVRVIASGGRAVGFRVDRGASQAALGGRIDELEERVRRIEERLGKNGRQRHGEPKGEGE